MLWFYVYSTLKRRRIIWRWRKEKWGRMMLLLHGKYIRHPWVCPCFCRFVIFFVCFLHFSHYLQKKERVWHTGIFSLPSMTQARPPDIKFVNFTFTFSSIPIDYNLYRKFWTLQDYFRNPVQCYDKFSWMTFLKVMHLTTNTEKLLFLCSQFVTSQQTSKQIVVKMKSVFSCKVLRWDLSSFQKLQARWHAGL